MIEREKITQERLKPVKLFLDDIASLAEIVGEISSNIKITADEYVLNDVAELARLGTDTVAHLSISAENLTLALEFTPFSASLSCGEKVPRRIHNRLHSLLAARRRRLAWVFRNTVPAILVGFSFSLALIGINRGFRLVIIGSILLFALSVFWAAWGFRSYFRHYSLIVPKPSDDKASFWLRNRDSAVIGTFLAIIGALIPIIINALFTGS
jgi:hypothetical protein